MDTITSRGISSIPLIRPANHPPKLLKSLYCRTRPHFIRPQLGFIPGWRHCSTLSVRSYTSDETSTDTTPHGKDKPEADGVIIVQNERLDGSKEDYDTNQLNIGPKEGSLIDIELFKFLKDLDLKFDYQDTYSLLVFGGGAAVSLWFAAAVVGAIDSIPLLPKVLELVGLGYTIWFTSRYVVFKENRDELFSKLEQMKQEVLGSADEK